MSEPAAEHDARRRIAGYLLAYGVRDRATRDRLLRALLDAVRHDPEARGPQQVVKAVARFEGFVDEVLARTAEPGQEPGGRAWLARELGALLERHADPFGDVEAVASDARASMPAPELPVLPRAHPQDMPRQPLGDLPSVLRGEFWVSAARWMLPTKKTGNPGPAPAAGGEPAGDTAGH